MTLLKTDWVSGKRGHDTEHNEISRRLWTIRDFGALGDGVDDTAAIQAALDAAKLTGGGTVFFPPGVYRTTAPLILKGNGVRLIGDSPTNTRLRNDVSDLFNSAGSLSNWEFDSLRLTASAGHVFAFKVLSGSRWERCLIEGWSPGHAIYQQLYDLAASGFVDNVMTHCQLSGTVDHTVPLWSLNCNPNRNSWRDCRVTYTGNYAFSIEVLHNNYAYDNLWDGINFEICNGGLIRLAGCVNHTIRDCHAYDAQVIGPYLRSLVALTTNSSSLKTMGTLISSTSRRGGDITGLLDIYINGANYTTLDTCINIPHTLIVSQANASNQNLSVRNCNVEYI